MSFAKITDFTNTIHYCNNILAARNWIRQEDLGCFRLRHTHKKKKQKWLLNISKWNDCLSHLFLGVRSEGLEKHKCLYQCGLSNFRLNKGCCGCNYRTACVCGPFTSPLYTIVTLLCTQDVAFRVRRRSATGREFLEMRTAGERLFAKRLVIELLCYHRKKGAQSRYTVKRNAVWIHDIAAQKDKYCICQSIAKNI